MSARDDWIDQWKLPPDQVSVRVRSEAGYSAPKRGRWNYGRTSSKQPVCITASDPCRVAEITHANEAEGAITMVI
jgi:hypothetical protein